MGAEDFLKEVASREGKVYSFTEAELNRIREEERRKGREEFRGYLIFSMVNYRYDISLGGALELVNDIIKFLKKDCNYIPNTCGCSFVDYIRNMGRN